MSEKLVTRIEFANEHRIGVDRLKQLDHVLQPQRIDGVRYYGNKQRRIMKERRRIYPAPRLGR